MTIKEPESMNELIYFTNRQVGEGNIMCWAYKGTCPKCGDGMMGKPKNPKTGRPKIRAEEYVCDKCGHSAEKEEYESTLNAQAKYTCPSCKHSGEIEFPFKRKSYQGVKALVFDCGGCDEKIAVTKKMATPKKKKK